MKRVRFTEEQIIGVLREQEAGAKGADLCRKYGMSEATLYNWKAKSGATLPRRRHADVGNRRFGHMNAPNCNSRQFTAFRSNPH